MSGDRFRFPGRPSRTDAADRTLAGMRMPVRAPDFSSAILDRVHAQRPFLSSTGRRWRVAGLAVCGLAMVGLAVGALAFGRWSARVVPGLAVRQPLADVVSCAVADASRSLRTIAQSGQSILDGFSPEMRPQTDLASTFPAYFAEQALRPLVRVAMAVPDFSSGSGAGVPVLPASFWSAPARIAPSSLASAAGAPAEEDGAGDLAEQLAWSFAGQPVQAVSLPR